MLDWSACLDAQHAAQVVCGSLMLNTDDLNCNGNSLPQTGSSDQLHALLLTVSGHAKLHCCHGY